MAVVIHQLDVRRILGKGGATQRAQVTYAPHSCLCRHCVAGIVDAQMKVQELGDASAHTAASLDSMLSDEAAASAMAP